MKKSLKSFFLSVYTCIYYKLVAEAAAAAAAAAQQMHSELNGFFFAPQAGLWERMDGRMD